VAYGKWQMYYPYKNGQADSGICTGDSVDDEGTGLPLRGLLPDSVRRGEARAGSSVERLPPVYCAAVLSLLRSILARCIRGKVDPPAPVS
jgi:hypothetical protein